MKQQTYYYSNKVLLGIEKDLTFILIQQISQLKNTKVYGIYFRCIARNSWSFRHRTRGFMDMGKWTAI